MADGHNSDDDLATGGSSWAAASADKSGALSAGWTWGSVSVFLQDGATELGGFSKDCPGVLAVVTHFSLISHSPTRLS